MSCFKTAEILDHILLIIFYIFTKKNMILNVNEVFIHLLF